jgi:uncharacterized OsmC-like protein
MDRDALRTVQAPLKERYRDAPHDALVTLTATGTLDDDVACNVQTGRALATAGLHPATGGDGSLLCSGDMLLEALVACAGVTLRAVAAALEIPVEAGTVTARGELDFRGTLGVDKHAPVGFTSIALRFEGTAPQRHSAAPDDGLVPLGAGRRLRSGGNGYFPLSTRGARGSAGG